ncbi:hypothetical protein P7K49_014254 [Saguinus oedipus]|uniref:Uncharacterized protein n=1 Tax=Saguinus oedipus TaxID=9490 RepID=A0ABQ9VJP3_SAGOE|nr:hypothetical protein P7K49_014254 [Saguinus oedipus]
MEECGGQYLVSISSNTPAHAGQARDHRGADSGAVGVKCQGKNPPHQVCVSLFSFWQEKVWPVPASDGFFLSPLPTVAQEHLKERGLFGLPAPGTTPSDYYHQMTLVAGHPAPYGDLLMQSGGAASAPHLHDYLNPVDVSATPPAGPEALACGTQGSRAASRAGSHSRGQAGTSWRASLLEPFLGWRFNSLKAQGKETEAYRETVLQGQPWGLQGRVASAGWGWAGGKSCGARWGHETQGGPPLPALLTLTLPQGFLPGEPFTSLRPGCHLASSRKSLWKPPPSLCPSVTGTTPSSRSYFTLCLSYLIIAATASHGSSAILSISCFPGSFAEKRVADLQG